MQQREMARPVEIDRNQAFREAYELFWQQGYRSTSLQHLLDAMKIGRGSFYAAFESKVALFVDVMSEYHRQTRGLIARIKEHHAGLAAIRAFIDQTLLNVPAKDRNKGCLAVNSVLELAGVNPTLHKHANRVLKTLEKALCQMVREGQDSRELDQSQPPEILVQVLLNNLQGLRVSSRTGMTRPELAATVEATIDLLKTSHEQS